MLIGMLMAVLIVGLLIVGPTFENTLVAVAVYGGIIVAMILGWWYSQRLSGGIAGMMLGVSNRGRAKETYDLAEKYETEQKFDDAVEVYREAIERDQKNPAPRIKLAGLYNRLGDYDNSIKYMKEALDMPKGLSQDERVSLINRLADLYVQKKQDPASAIKVLKQIVKEFPNTQYALYARERAHQIRKDM